MSATIIDISSLLFFHSNQRSGGFVNFVFLSKCALYERHQLRCAKCRVYTKTQYPWPYCMLTLFIASHWPTHHIRYVNIQKAGRSGNKMVKDDLWRSAQLESHTKFEAMLCVVMFFFLFFFFCCATVFAFHSSLPTTEQYGYGGLFHRLQLVDHINIFCGILLLRVFQIFFSSVFSLWICCFFFL